MGLTVDNNSVNGADGKNGVNGPIISTKKPALTPEDIEKHTANGSIWISINNNVYGVNNLILVGDLVEAPKNDPYYEKHIEESKKHLDTPTFDPKDVGFPDHWIKRDRHLIRSIDYPFNAEPPLSLLLEHGFITPPPLHYVRNHTGVPKLTKEEWYLEVGGLVDKPTRFTFNELVNKFPYREFPSTFACCGNRRKELKQLRLDYTRGFNWGPGAISTSVWRGVPLRLVLEYCKVKSRSDGAHHVCFEGWDERKQIKGDSYEIIHYGTSIPIEYAQDPARDVIIAYKQNGEDLPPDHGFPVRMIVPGFIGGRMTKWLKSITVTENESDNHFHVQDNKVFPSFVDDDIASSQGWWNKPDYIVNALHIQSVIIKPSHGEKLPIDRTEPYTLKGYAFSGDGKKIIRVEISLDGGQTWKVTELHRFEKPNEYKKYWCWCFWSREVPAAHLLEARDIAVRAWDETTNTQHQEAIWNLLGMMNNCWFRVKSKEITFKGQKYILYETPTVPGMFHSGGWMEKGKHVPTPYDPTDPRAHNYYTMEEVKTHNSRKSAWVVKDGHVHDVTTFIDRHPGGEDNILKNAGTDITARFIAIGHGNYAKNLLKNEFWIGELLPSDDFQPRDHIPDDVISCTLEKKVNVTHNVRLFKFKLPEDQKNFQVPVANHIFIHAATHEEEYLMRAYTPIGPVDADGCFSLVIKIYPKGAMTQYLDKLPIGSPIRVSIPHGDIEYAGRGTFLVKGKEKTVKKLTMVAGGTGITPMLSIIKAIMNDPEDKTEVHLVYANRTEDDIVLKHKFDTWAKEDKRLNVWYVVQHSITEGWAHSEGFISKKVLRAQVPFGADDTLALVCGPPKMMQKIPSYLGTMKYDTKEQVIMFGRDVEKV